MPTDRQRAESEVFDLSALARASAGHGAIWSALAEDLNVNLVAFDPGQGVDEHVNAELDVLVVGIAGEGTLEVDGRRLPLAAGQATIVPKGSRRAIRAGRERFVYLTCHRRRAGLWPTPDYRAAQVDDRMTGE